MYLTIAFRNLRQGGKRTSILGVALMGVSGLLTLLLCLTNGLNDSIIRAAETISAGHVNVSGFWKSSPTAAGIPIVTDFDKLKEDVLQDIPGFDFAIDRHRGWAKVVSDEGAMRAGLFGINIEEERHLNENLIPARESDYVDGGRDEVFGRLSDLAEPKTAMIFAGQAKILGVKVGDKITLRTETMRGVSNTVDLTIVAIMKDMGMITSWNLFMPKETLIELYNLDPDTTGALMIYLKDIDRSADVMDLIRDRMAEHGYELMDHDPNPFFMKFETVNGQDFSGQKIDLTTWNDEVSFMSRIRDGINGVTFTLLMVLMGIVTLGIVNALWIAVRERTREIGTLRAIGMQRRGILIMVVFEAGILGLIATSIGVFGGAGIALGIEAMGITIPEKGVQMILLTEKLHLVVDMSQLLMTIGAFTVFTMVASIWPAFKAARMDPITAIQMTK